MKLTTTDKIKISLKEISIRLLTLDYLVIKSIIKKNFKTNSRERVLDVGCGTGIISKLFLPENYTGIDMNEKLIDYARLKYPEYNFKVIDSSKLAFSKYSSDKVLIVGVIHHLNPHVLKKTLIGLTKLLKAGGYILAVEAIQPINKFNFLGKILRNHDEGHHILSMDEYYKIFSKYFRTVKSYEQHGGLFDYGVFILSNPF